MAALFTTLERCVVPLPSSPAKSGGTDGYLTIRGAPYTYLPPSLDSLLYPDQERRGIPGEGYCPGGS